MCILRKLLSRSGPNEREGSQESAAHLHASRTRCPASLFPAPSSFPFLDICGAPTHEIPETSKPLPTPRGDGMAVKRGRQTVGRPAVISNASLLGPSRFCPSLVPGSKGREGEGKAKDGAAGEGGCGDHALSRADFTSFDVLPSFLSWGLFLPSPHLPRPPPTQYRPFLL